MSSIWSVNVGPTDVPEMEHRHVVGVYERDDELVSAILSFLIEGLAHGGPAIVVATPAHRGAVESALVASGLDLEELQRSGRYRSLDASTALAEFMVGDRPDLARFESFVEPILAEATGHGGPVRVFGEMVALLWDEGNIAAAIELESLWNDLATRHRFALFCAYPLSSLDASADLAGAKGMCDRHSSVLSLPADTAEGEPLVAEVCDAYDRLFIAVPEEVRSVRDFVRDALRLWGDEVAGSEAEVIASELASNAVRHAHSPFRVQIARTSSTVRVAVRDASFVPPDHLCSDGDHVGGRGVHLVASLSQSWGTLEEVDGKTVWAEVVRHPAQR